jgi:hypothetical protein
MNCWILTIQEDPDTGDGILEFPTDLLQSTGWKEGDKLEWKDLGNGSWSLSKQENTLVLVECVNQFRTRYLVEVPKGKQEWALDTVTMNEAKEFSQQHLTETIVSSRVISEKDALALCKQDNNYMFTNLNRPEQEVLSSLITREGI